MTTPKERPILFSGEMVKAILEDRKTMIRRVMKEPWKVRLPMTVRGDFPFQATWAAPGIYEAQHNRYGAVSVVATSNGKLLGIKPAEFEWVTPYGKVGDRLWVRETWGFSAKLPASTRDEVSWLAYPELRAYRSDNPEGNWCWRPSLFMPRWASRITLKVTGVKAERVQNISEEDSKAEGLYEWASDKGVNHYGITRADVWEKDPRVTYKRLWDSINAKRGYSWESNPWVWAIEFKRVDASAILSTSAANSQHGRCPAA